MTLKDELAIHKYAIALEDEIKFFQENLMWCAGQFGLQHITYLQADRLIRRFGMSPDLALKIVSKNTGAFN